MTVLHTNANITFARERYPPVGEMGLGLQIVDSQTFNNVSFRAAISTVAACMLERVNICRGSKSLALPNTNIDIEATVSLLAKHLAGLGNTVARNQQHACKEKKFAGAPACSREAPDSCSS